MRQPNSIHLCLLLRASGGVLLAMLLVVSVARGQEFKWEGLDFHWTNTVKYSTAVRVAGPDRNLMISDNFDDSANNFPQGSWFSNRGDLLSELDIRRGSNFWLRVSGAGWYDSIYATSNSNRSATDNNFSVPGNEFTSIAKDYAARRFELLDAFLYYRKSLGGDRAISFKIGRQTLLWGESLYMVTNGISYGQAPIDFAKAAAVPQTQAKELFMPVGQATVHFDFNSTWSLDGYYQFEERASRTPPAGAYFEPFDAPAYGGERIFAFNPPYPPEYPTFLPAPAFFRGSDIVAADSGNFGVKVEQRLRKPSWDLGYYFYEFNAREPELYIRPGAIPCPFPLPNPACPEGVLVINPSIYNPLKGEIGDFRYVSPEHIKLAGASLGSAIGKLNLAGELSFRWNMPLLSRGLVDLSALTGPPAPDNDHHPLYPIGNMAYVNISAIYVTSRTPLFTQANLTGEVGYNHLMKIVRNPQNFDPNRSTDAYAFVAGFEPEYFQVLPGLDIHLPVTLGYSPRAKSASDPDFNGGADRGGNITPGVTFIYRENTVATVKYTHYWGKDTGLIANPLTGIGGPTAGMQLSRGKDFVSISIQRTF